MKRSLHALRLFLGLFLALFVAVPSALGAGGSPTAIQADANTPGNTGPRDAPQILDASQIHIPPIPANYTERDLGWLHLSYVPAAHERVEPLVAKAAEMKAKLEEHFGAPVLAHVDVRVARTTEEMATLAPVGLPPPPYASGVAYPALHLVLLTLSAPDASADAPNLEEVFDHELAHVALEDAIAGHHVPLWFNEGVAIYESGELPFLRVKTLSDATLSKTVIPLSDIDRGFPNERYEVNIAYAESADFVRFLLRDADRGRFVSLLERVRRGEPFERSLGDAYGTNLRKLEYEWREELFNHYSLIPVLTGGSLIWVLLIAMMAVGYVRRRRVAKATLSRWELEEAALDAAVAAANEAERRAPIGTGSDTVGEQMPHRLNPGLPKIEHDGGWHTIH